MRIYTYCSYQGSPIGYEYLMLDSQQKSYSKIERIEADYMVWFEERSDWKMVLKKSDNNRKACLFLGRLESAVNMENERRRYRREEIEENKYMKEKDKEGRLKDIKYLDIKRYINMAIVDDYEMLECLAIGILYEFNQDYGLTFYENIVEQMKVEGQSYKFDVEGLVSVFKEIIDSVGFCGKRRNPQEKSNKIIGRIINKKRKNRSPIVIAENSDIRKNDFALFIEDNWKVVNQYQKNVLFVAENEDVSHYGTFGMEIDYNYFFRKGM